MFVTKKSNPKYEPVDTYFKNTSMLLHGENIDAANYPTIDYAGGGGYFFNGSTSYLTAPDSANFELGSSAFTIEMWIYPTSTAAEQILINKVATGSVVGSFDIRMSTTGTIRTLVATTAGAVWANDTTSTLTVNFNQWNHVAFVRSGNVFTRYINGVSAGGYTSAITLVNEATTLNVGANGNGSSKFTGYMSNVRVVNGSAVYTADFTPPTEPLNVITNTVLLLKAKTIGSPADSALGTTITVNGGVQAFPTFSPFSYNQSSALPPGGTSSGAMDINTSDGSTGSGSGPPYIDVSQNKIPVTTVGLLWQGPFSPYSQTGYSGYFDGTGDYFTVPYSAGNFSMGSGDFTIECWVMMQGTENPGRIFNAWNSATASASSWEILNAAGTNLYFSFSTNGVSATTITKSSLARNTWYHLAAVRNGNVFTFYVNGTSAGTSTQAITLQTPDFVTIGARRSGASYVEPFNGFISNVRVVKGTAVYTADFTPPTRKLEAITNTTLLTLQNPYVKDNSTNNLTLTRVGDVTVRPFSPFVKSYSAPSNLGSSVYNNAATRYVIMKDGKYQNATQFGLRDFCVECWVYFDTLGANRVMVESWTASVGWQLYYTNTTAKFAWFNAAAITLSSTTTPVIGQWYHVAVSRSNYVSRMYVNGVLEASVADTTNYAPTTPLVTGIQFSTLTNPMAGYLSDVRITTSNPVYGGNFTPPAGPLQPIDGTQFLLKAKEIGIKDITGKNNAQVQNNVRISTAIKKFNTGSILFGGTSDYIQIPYNVNNHHMADRDFTVECWAYPAGNDSVGRIINAWNTGTTSYASWEMYWQNGNTFGAQFSSAGTAANATLVSTTSWHGTYGTPQRNNWYHLALVRANSVFTFYVNGASAGSNTQPSAYTLQVPDTVTIAARRSGGSLVEPFNGCLDEIRITPGIARYTGNFTVPDRAFPNR